MNTLLMMIMSFCLHDAPANISKLACVNSMTVCLQEGEFQKCTNEIGGDYTFTRIDICRK